MPRQSVGCWLLDKLDQHGAGLISLGETFDTQTAAGRAMVQMIGVFAEWELATTRERTAQVRQRKQQNGEHVGGKAPLGYRIAKNGDGVSVLEPDPEERRAIKMAKELRGRLDCSLQDIADAFNEETMPRRNGRPWTRQAVSRLLE
jgi:site-specific DNA recombinase